jgi:hypothetical protein
MDNNNMNTEFKDFPATQIQDKLQQCVNYEAKYGECMTVTSWKKWCESYEFRKNEWEFRQNVAKSVKYGI